MFKKYAFLLVLILLSTFTYAEIMDTIKLGETKYYFTPEHNFSIAFPKFDLLTERASFIIDGKQSDLLKLQTRKIANMDFLFIDSAGTSFEDFEAGFIITGNSPFECSTDCKESFLVNLIRIFDPDFQLCKKDCTMGCGLYKEKKCIDNETWVINNCYDNLEMLEKCEEENYFNCDGCEKPDFCISDKDCGTDNSCISGKCSKQQYIIGDGICSLPNEDCSSSDCSCGNDVISPKDKEDIPILLIHGFASSSGKLVKLQRALHYDLGYENGGGISSLDLDCPTDKKKTVYIASYYEKTRSEKREGMIHLLHQSYSKIAGKKGSGDYTFIETFSDIINKVKSCSDSDKVNIIAHSMGGLVLRSYLLRDDNIKNINKVILLGSPNHGGIYGTQSYSLFKGLKAPLGDRKQLLKDCATIGMPSIVMSLIDGRDVSEDCQQMQQAGSISNPILKIDETPGLVEYYTIAGDIDGKGDGLVPLKSAALDGAVLNKVVSCDHFDLKDASRCAESYHAMVQALGHDLSELKQHTLLDNINEFMMSIGDFFAGLSGNVGYAFSQQFNNTIPKQSDGQVEG